MRFALVRNRLPVHPNSQVIAPGRELGAHKSTPNLELFPGRALYLFVPGHGFSGLPTPNNDAAMRFQAVLVRSSAVSAKPPRLKPGHGQIL
jgi:hypothetical protein